MSFIIGLLTIILVLDCLALVLLVLVQLPKKYAGAGLAFGGAATDALFGAGSGTALTKITKYAATIFFVAALILAVLQSRRGVSEFERRLQQGPAPQAQPALPVAPSQAPAPTTSTDPAPAAEATPTPAPPPQGSAPK